MSNRRFQIVDKTLSESVRRGISRIDAIVVIIVLGLLISLTLPAVQNARSGRGLAHPCKLNLKNLGLALHNYATLFNGHLPPLDDGLESWPAKLDYLADTVEAHRLKRAGRKIVTKPVIKEFTCPDDPNNFRKPYGLSYVANAGYGNFSWDDAGRVSEDGLHTAEIDLDGDGRVSDREIEIDRSTGVFWRRTERSTALTLDEISQRDGLGQTLMLTENLNARNWLSRNTMDIAFVIGRKAITFADDEAGKSPLALESVNLGPFGINRNKGTLPGQSPAPSSNHPGGVNVLYGDGTVRWLSTEIDPTIYARLMTPGGLRLGQAPLSDSDY